MIRTMLVDDHAALRSALRDRMAREPDFAVVGEAATTEEAVGMTRALKPDVVLLDLLLPTRGGCETIPDLIRHAPVPCILVMSSQAAPSWVRRALSVGRAGTCPRALASRSCSRRYARSLPAGRYVEPTLGARLVVDPSASAFEPLSERERDVMQLIALGYTYQEIAERLFISARTVDAHRAHIMVKLGMRSRAELVICALSNGILGP
jgi:DNA-binding NarL/FixJ family response regulator